MRSAAHSAPVRNYRLSRGEYDRAVEAGVFEPDAKLELIDGDLRTRPHGPVVAGAGGSSRCRESPGAAGPGRDGAPRHVGVRTVPRTRHQAGERSTGTSARRTSCASRAKKVLAS